MQIFNCHAHIFTSKIIPDQLLPLLLRPVAGMLKNNAVAAGLARFFDRSGLSDWAAVTRRHHALLTVGGLPSQEAVFQDLQGFYPLHTRFIVLSMDLEYLQAGKVQQSFEEQLQELARLKRNPKYSNYILPFICLHPERPNLFRLVRKYIEQEGFSGLNIYPPLGYYPFDQRLYKIYEYAQDNNIPLITHCARGGLFYRNNISKEMLVHPKTGARLSHTKPRQFADYFSEPDNYIHLLKDFPNLKLCFAHFGGEEEWEKYLSSSWHPKTELLSDNWYSKVCQLMRVYPNVYADISYTLRNPRFMHLLKVTLQDPVLRLKVLFGSNYYLMDQERTEREYSIGIRAFLGETDYRQIAEVNPITFLRRGLESSYRAGGGDLAVGALW